MCNVCLFQHYPMYRRSDSNCTGPDQAPPKEKYAKFREKWDCISRSASKKVREEISEETLLRNY